MHYIHSILSSTRKLAMYGEGSLAKLLRFSGTAALAVPGVIDLSDVLVVMYGLVQEKTEDLHSASEEPSTAFMCCGLCWAVLCHAVLHCAVLLDAVL